MQLYRVGVAGVLVWSGIVWPGVVSSQSRTLEFVGVIPGAVTTVHVHDTYAFVSDGPTLRIHDIANPATPVLLGSYTFPQNIYGVDVSGSVAYAAVDFYGLGILDVSNPAAPTLLASFDIPGQALSVAVSNSIVVVANRLSGLEVIDVSDPRLRCRGARISSMGTRSRSCPRGGLPTSPTRQANSWSSTCRGRTSRRPRAFKIRPNLPRRWPSRRRVRVSRLPAS